jgi:hypothetical protein
MLEIAYEMGNTGDQMEDIKSVDESSSNGSMTKREQPQVIIMLR